MSVNLDDMDGFMANLGGAMAAQEAAGISLAPKADTLQVPTDGISIKRRPLPIPPPPSPVEYELRPLTKRLATVDLETDPFKHGRRPEAFAAGFAEDDEPYISWWGPNCIVDFFDHLTRRAAALRAKGIELVVYAHNGGKFDFNFFLRFLDDDSAPFLIDTRLVKIMFAGVEFRDSYSLMPVALKKLKSHKWAKKEIDIGLMEPLLRDAHRVEIETYLEADCMTLLDMVRDYIDRFGWALTMAGVALGNLRAFHGFDEMEPEVDAEVRPYYKGGRVQCFATGVIMASPGKRLVMVDRNSMYPSEMAQALHPVSAVPRRWKDIRDDTDFALIEARNMGALGVGDGLGYDFTVSNGKFFASIHEIRAGLETKTLEIKRVLSSFSFVHKSRFDTFVDHFYGMRQVARREGDLAGVEFYKLVLNSAYGKLAMNTIGYKDFIVNPESIPTPLYAMKVLRDEEGTVTHAPNGWAINSTGDGYTVWSRPTRGAGQRFLNVATAASITGAARASLWRAICQSERPLYCDTDSIICETFHGETDDAALGAWKIEATGDAVCIGGKKMYAFLSRERPEKEAERVTIDGSDFWLLKKAHKGVQLRAEQILEICRGDMVEHISESPTFKLNGDVRFQKRRVRMTGGKSPQLELFEEEVAA